MGKTRRKKPRMKQMTSVPSTWCLVFLWRESDQYAGRMRRFSDGVPTSVSVEGLGKRVGHRRQIPRRHPAAAIRSGCCVFSLL